MRLALLIIVLCLFLSGCGGRRASMPPAADESPQSSSDMPGRLEAAKAIFDTNKRDAALAALAQDAAEAGEGEAAKEAVRQIFSTNARDDAGYHAAVALARAGKAEEAKAVADLMFSTNRKDEAMAKIATGGK